MKKIVVQFIRLYQSTLSPDHGWLRERFPYGYCRYYPSCSQYAVEVIMHRGVWKGVTCTIWRVLRCNPFSSGGIDLVQIDNKSH